MAVIDLPEKLANEYSTDDVLSWVESQLKTMRQISVKKETDKSFVLGQIATGLQDTASVVTALRKKLKPTPEDGAPIQL